MLAANGHFVYAGARKDKDLAELNKMDNVEAVRLDVTVQDDIDAAVARITEAGRGLHGVVNNAGVGVFSPMNETPEADIDFVFDVNIYGPYRINKAFTPLLAENKGRTTTIGSISGFISGRRSGTYSMSKFAIEAYTDALAAELAESGVLVSVIEPGGFKSKIREKVVLHAMGKTSAEAGDLTAEEQEQLNKMRERNASLKEPDEVAEATLHALFAEKPKPRYMVAPDRGRGRSDHPGRTDAGCPAQRGPALQLQSGAAQQDARGGHGGAVSEASALISRALPVDRRGGLFFAPMRGQ